MRYHTEKSAQNKLRAWIYENYEFQWQAAEFLGTTNAYLGHVVNHRKSLTKKMQDAIGLKREIVVRYKKAD